MTFRSLAGTVLLLVIVTGCQFSGCDSESSKAPQPEPPITQVPPPPSSAPSAEPLATITVPVLLVPGILGSWTKDPSVIEKNSYVRDFREWVLAERYFGYIVGDVFGHIKHRLIARGYREGKELFEAPYDWRRSVSEHDAITAWIDVARAEFKLSTGKIADQVDVVAHSMGGLVVRSYVQSKLYRSDIRRLAVVATPNFGAADAYYLWAGGRIPPNGISARAASFLQNRLAAMNTRIDPDRTRSLTAFVRSYVLSGRDLLPVAVDAPDKESFVSGWPEPGPTVFTAMNPLNRNETLAALNASFVELKARTNVWFFLGKDRPTLAQINVEKPLRSGMWEDGEPVRDAKKHKFTEGDERVILMSSPLSTVAGVEVAPTSHQSAICVFTPDIFKFFGVPVTGQDRCWADPRPPASAIAFGLSTTSKADLSVSGPEGKLVGFKEGRVLRWDAPGSVDLVVVEPRDGLYEITVAGEAGEHQVFVTYAKAPLLTEFVQPPAFTFAAPSTDVVRIELKDETVARK